MNVSPSGAEAGLWVRNRGENMFLHIPGEYRKEHLALGTDKVSNMRTTRGLLS